MKIVLFDLFEHGVLVEDAAGKEQVRRIDNGADLQQAMIEADAGGSACSLVADDLAIERAVNDTVTQNRIERAIEGLGGAVLEIVEQDDGMIGAVLQPNIAIAIVGKGAIGH